jgi:glycine hydroxymethyltransferase
MEALLEVINIYANKNTIPRDKSALVPSGLRVG